MVVVPLSSWLVLILSALIVIAIGLWAYRLVVREPGEAVDATRTRQSIARLTLLTFLLVFAGARILVFLIMTRRLPDLYLHVGGTHVHHLNYGIFMLSGVGGYLLFWRPDSWRLRLSAILYGAGMALTFDEFGMWVHLGGPYWQRASFDAVVIIASLIGLVALAPTIARFTPRDWLASALVVATLGIFAWLFADTLRSAEAKMSLELKAVEAESPP